MCFSRMVGLYTLWEGLKEWLFWQANHHRECTDDARFYAEVVFFIDAESFMIFCSFLVSFPAIPVPAVNVPLKIDEN
jgi:hypothetical protein